MNHLGTKRLETERLVLRRFTVDDAQAMYDNWASDPEVTKFLMWPTHASVEVSREVLEDWTAHYSELNYYHWAITLKEYGDSPIGGIGVVSQKENAQLVHIGYCIGRGWWRRGIMSEALAALMKFFFDEVGVNRVESRHDPRNPNSGKVMLKCGMQYEGNLRQADSNNQGICDSSQYGILASEYRLLGQAVVTP